MSGYPDRYEQIVGQIDEALALLDDTLRQLRRSSRVQTSDAIQLGKAIASVAISADVAKAAVSALGRTTKAMWENKE